MTEEDAYFIVRETLDFVDTVRHSTWLTDEDKDEMTNELLEAVA